MISSREGGGKRLWPNLQYYYDICQEWLRKFTKICTEIIYYCLQVVLEFFFFFFQEDDSLRQRDCFFQIHLSTELVLPCTQRSRGAVCYHNFTQHHYDFILQRDLWYVLGSRNLGDYLDVMQESNDFFCVRIDLQTLYFYFIVENQAEM
jgi:hypothetical protein